VVAGLVVPGFLALVLAGCGGGGGENVAGRKVFTMAGCGGCHTLSAAGTKGTVGPNLDQARADKDRVIRQVTQGGGAMPSFKDRLSAGEIADVADFVAAATRTATGGGSVAANFKPDGTTLADCATEFRCYEQAFANIAYREGPKRALTLLERKELSPGPIESDCHRITHAIGAGALEHFDGDPGAALAAGSVICASGYYHGILERSLLGLPEAAIGPLTQEICSAADIRRTDFIHFQCVHGLGHGLMIYTGYDLMRSLDYCEGLANDWERESCRGGVFMENSQSSYGVRSRWLKDDDLIFPCNAVPKRDKYQCYLIQLARIAPALNDDWPKVAATCRKAEEDYVAVCFESMGREVSGWARFRAPEILRICRLAGDMERECVYGAARDVTYNDAGPGRAKLLCGAAAANLRGHCWEGVGAIVGTLFAEDNPKRAACKRATRAHYLDCIRGANVPEA
jgi:cytochrome c553